MSNKVVQITPSDTLSEENFESLLSEHQAALRAYIISLAANNRDCDDILQDTNLYLWENRATFEPNSSFKAWAFKTAYFKMLARKRDRSRLSESYFSDTMMEQLASEAEERFGNAPERIAALRKCLGLLNANELKVIKAKYLLQQSLTHYALTAGKSIASTHKQISRLRLSLRDCIQKRLDQA